ncbi:MAG TPA: membrane dipeptidase [Candidatus Dormibacteraeota bacterium]|nr:membrane dipeptidase [Candidatus Dormibacteraeota bacterium]
MERAQLRSRLRRRSRPRLPGQPQIAGSSRVDLVFATLFAAPETDPELAETGQSYRTPSEARLLALAQLGYYRAVGPPIVRTRAALARPGLQAVVLMGAADPIETPAQVEDWWERGVRIVGPAWDRTRYAGGTHAPGGLTATGRRLLESMAAAGMILDLSHLAEQVVEEAMAAWRGPMIASHSNARALVDGDRQLVDATAAEVGRRDGVLGVSFYRGHLRADGARPGLDDVVAHLLHLAAAAGGPEHVGLGSDCDGGFARVRDLRPLLRHHFSEGQVEGIMSAKWLAFLKRALPTG